MREGSPLAATVELRGQDFLVGWDAAASRLFVSSAALVEGRAGALAAVRIGIRGTGIAATVMGTVVAVRRAGTPSLPAGVSLALDPRGASAARYLALVSQGRPVEFNEREPRYALERPVTVAPEGADRFESNTVNVSASGCCVRWPGPAPGVGDTLRIRPGRTFLAPAAWATVCWAARAADQGGTAGLRLDVAGRAARTWRSLVEQAARSGAPLI